MRLTRTGKPENHYFYIIEDYKDENGKKKTRTVEALGCANVICQKYNVNDAEAWCQLYLSKKNEEQRQSKVDNKRELVIKLREHMPKKSKSCIFNAGYLILDKLFHEFGLSHICDNIMKEHPHINGFDLKEVLRVILFGRVISPSSKLALVNEYQTKFLEQYNLEPQHIYRAMDLLAQNNNLIQDSLYQYTAKACDRDIHHLYYDCTNFFSEKELEDCDVKGKSDEWYANHTLRKYGKSKENRPNPIVQMGLFMDGNGIPLGFNITPGNENEQKTMVPLEKRIIENFKQADIIVCTDCGLSGEDNRKFNNKDQDDPLVQIGLLGQRRFICTQSIKKLKAFLKEWSTETEGWCYIKKGENGKSVIVKNFSLTKLEDEISYLEHYRTVFFRERTTAENNLDSRLIVTFSLKYRDYMRELRERKIKRANKMIESGTYATESDRSPRSLIEKSYTTKKGEAATKHSAKLNTQKIEDDARFDGFYAVTTNIFPNEMPVEKIAAISARRWEIEECFRIMKTDLEARPFYHSTDNRILAHFQTCFLSLVLLRGIEQRLASYIKGSGQYPYFNFTLDQILLALKNVNVIAVDSGNGFQPDYDDSELITKLLECFDLKELTHEVVMKDTMKKILKKIKTAPEKIKNSKKR